MDGITFVVGSDPVTEASDMRLADALALAIDIMDKDRQLHGFTSYRNAPMEERVTQCETALLALATLVMRRMGEGAW